MTMAEVRRATPEDLAPLRDAVIASWMDTYVPIHGKQKVLSLIDLWYAPEKMAARIAAENQFCGVGLLNGAIVGGIFAGMIDETLYIKMLHLTPEARGQGIGQILFRAALDAFPEALSATLEVDEGNPRAVKFYERLGMNVTGKTNTCGGDSDIAALIMTMPLTKIDE